MMKTFRHILLFLQAAILLGLTACHDDFGNNFDDDGTYTPQISTGIVLKIPNLNQFATRAVANTCAGEGTVKDGDIHLFLFNQSGGPDVYMHLGASDFDNAYSKLPSLDKDGNEIFAGARKVNGVDG
ncbi:MAG: hypothetical protein K2H15_02065 [Muribaculaceae bacterium]|nr:hypothetical protein [Muribaculaceae bacterium]